MCVVCPGAGESPYLDGESKDMQDQEVIREFIVESYENLSRLDQELVELEQRPKDRELLTSIFRTIHTIKGTCGFLAFSTLEKITHQAESLLSRLRDGQCELDSHIVTLILETVDATRKILAAIEATNEEGPDRFEDLTERLRAAVSASDAEKSDRSPSEPGVGGSPVTAPEAENSEGASAGVEAAKPETDATKSSAIADANIRVGVGLLDNLMDLVGELVLARNQILQFNSEREDPALNATAQRLNLITSELQEGVMKTRMQPIGVIWNKLPRVVRDMAQALGKQIHLEMDGAETELDRTIIEAIKDPLVHLVRNSCDHGIEPPDARTSLGKPTAGKLLLRAYHEGGQVNIEISDDGAGIDVATVRRKAIEKGMLRPEQAEKLSDRETLNLVFQPGFSTAQKVTTVSGRGVGMDVVKSHIEKIGGIVDIASQPGEGTAVKLKIPLTLAIIPGLVITSGGERFVIPQVSLLELIRLESDSSEKRIEHVHGTPVYRRRGTLLPIAYLNNVLGLTSGAQADATNIIVLQAEDRQFGLVVDGINDTQEIVVKPLSKQLKGLSIYAGATIMGDGRVALILDVLGIGQRSGVLSEIREQSRTAAEQRTEFLAERKQRMLLFRTGSFQRLAVPLSLVSRLEEFPQDSIEKAGDSQVVQYRGHILPLIPLRDVLCAGEGIDPSAAPHLQVVVFHDGERSVGIVVDQILDVVEEAIEIKEKSSRKGLLGSAVLGGRVTDILDLNSILRSSGASWFKGRGSDAGKRVLVAARSPFLRGLVRCSLDMEGHRVAEAGDLDETIRILERQAVDVVLADLDLSPKGSGELIAALRAKQEWRKIPILGLTNLDGRATAASAPAPGYRELVDISDSEAVLESVARMSSNAPIPNDAAELACQER